MERLKSHLSGLPSWLLTALTVLLIMWLTLSPDPLGPEPPKLFPGADKIVHALMFGFLTAMVCLDKERKNGWSQLSARFLLIAAISSALFGAIIEVAQFTMNLGRGFENGDIIADTVGAMLVALLWKWLQPQWSRRI